MPLLEMYPTFVKFKQWAKQLEKPVRKEARVSFSNYFKIDRPSIKPNIVYKLTPEQLQKVQQFNGPYGKALFTVWVVQRTSIEELENVL